MCLCARHAACGTMYAAVLIGVSAAAARGAGAQTTGATPGGRVSFPTYGVELQPPPGWSRDNDTRHDIIAHWEYYAPGNASREFADAFIQAELSSVPGQSAADTAAKYARLMGGSVLPEPILVDGQQAKVVAIPRKDSGLCELRAVFVDRGKCVFSATLTATGAAPADVVDVFDRFCRNVRWTKTESPAQHLVFLPDAVPILDGAIRLRLLALMKPATSEHAGETTHVLCDYRTRIPALSMVAYVAENKGAKPMSALTRGLGAALAKGAGSTTAVAWTPVAGATPVYASSFVGVRAAGVPAGSKVLTLYVLAKISANRVGVLMFGVTSTDEQELAAYKGVIKRIVASIEVNAAK